MLYITYDQYNDLIDKTCHYGAGKAIDVALETLGIDVLDDDF